MATPPPSSTRTVGGVWGFVLVFICVIVTIDVLYIHQKGFQLSLADHGILGFSPPEKAEKPWEQETFPPVKNDAEKLEDMKAAQEEQMKEAEEESPGEKVSEEDNVHKVAGLSCTNYGGPSDEDAAEMVFWNDIPEDAVFISPFKRKESQYLTFEPGTNGLSCELCYCMD
jgi:hypothetical protein